MATLIPEIVSTQLDHAGHAKRMAKTWSLGRFVRERVAHSFGAEVVEFELEKAIKSARDTAQAGIAAPETIFYDPTQMFFGRDWLVKANQPLTFNDLRLMAKNPIIASIVLTRINQVAAFCQPQPNPYEPGFVIESDDPQKNADKQAKQAISNFLWGCGIRGYGEPNLETLTRKCIRDSLVLDQSCFEVVPRNNGLPAYMVGVDAATVRRVKRSLEFYDPPKDDIFYVQILLDTIVSEYTYDQLYFGVRNPTSEMATAGYGTSELEVLVRIVTAIVNTDKYNVSQVAQGGTSKGVFVIKGTVTPMEKEAFSRDIREAVRNAGSYWRIPVLSVGDKGEVDWVPLDRSARDMEFARLFDFLVKQACAVYQISPEEINWSIGATGQTTTYEARMYDKIAVSQQRGLDPLLKSWASGLNQKVLATIDPDYRIRFAGLNNDRMQDATIAHLEGQTRKTVNELRADIGLPPIANGDVVIGLLMAGKGGPGGSGGQQAPSGQTMANSFGGLASMTSGGGGGLPSTPSGMKVGNPNQGPQGPSASGSDGSPSVPRVAGGGLVY